MQCVQEEVRYSQFRKFGLGLLDRTHLVQDNDIIDLGSVLHSLQDLEIASYLYGILTVGNI